MEITKEKEKDLKKRGLLGKRWGRKVEGSKLKKLQRWMPSADQRKDSERYHAVCECGVVMATFMHWQGQKDPRYNNFDIEYFQETKEVVKAKLVKENGAMKEKRVKVGEWVGCRGVNVQKNSMLSFECCCGNDNRPTVKQVGGFTLEKI